MILVTKWFGAFLCDEGKVRKAALFPKDAKEVAARLLAMRNGEVLAEEQQLASSAREVVDGRLHEFGKRVKFDSSFIKPENYGFTLDIYREATIALAKQAAKESVGPDVHLGQAVRAYSDLVFTSNMLSERLHEWYGLHFPELENVLSGEGYSKAISEWGSRENVLSSLKMQMDSIGSDVEAEDLESIRVLAQSLLESQSARARVENYIDLRMREVAPNITSLVGPVIGARLMMHAGSLKRLASMPAGTVQLLGAEKAMFRHLKEGSRPPKHGVLFTHPMVRNAPGWQRGAIARALAAKLCLAARADTYSRNDISALLKEQFEKRVAEIRKQHPAPPKKGPGRKKGRRR
ncbi:MAG: ribosomal biogenesis protein [Thermoplasmata archaeon]|nr:ribosomal biogenesis protein [Thermoplasmata archaeon]